MTREFRPQAWQELIDAARWYLDDGGPAVAEQFEAAIERALRLLDWMPQIGSPGFPGVRTWALRRFPYTLVYRVQDEVITVIAVAHQSREPGYWRGR